MLLLVLAAVLAVAALWVTLRGAPTDGASVSRGVAPGAATLRDGRDGPPGGQAAGGGHPERHAGREGDPGHPPHDEIDAASRRALERVLERAEREPGPP